MPARGAFLQEVLVRAHRSFVAILFLLCAASTLRAQNTFPLHVTDDTGAAVTLPARPVRIISLTLATDEMLLTMVDPARVVGVSLFADDPGISNVADRAAGIANKLDVNVETILSLRPDLVLVADWSDAGPVRQLLDAGVPLYLMKSAITVASIQEKIMRLALLTGEGARGREMIAEMQGRLSAVDRRVSALPAEKRLRAIDYATWGAAMGRGSSWDEMLRRAGLVDGVGELSADEWGQVPLSREKLLRLDPDLLVLPGWVYGDPKRASAFFAQITGDPSLKGLRAVRTGRVYQMPEKLKSTTSQYFAEAVEWLARTAYPGLFR
jgi:iron complex transport system substrate-binding protein